MGNCLQILCQACSTKQTRRVPKKKTCHGPTGNDNCLDPIRYPGKSDRENCIKKTGGNPTKKVKRKVKVHFKKK